MLPSFCSTAVSEIILATAPNFVLKLSKRGNLLRDGPAGRQEFLHRPEIGLSFLLD